MEWKVTAKAPFESASFDVMKVDADGDLKFIIWVISNLPIREGYILTPVIDGYIANHNRAHFVSIKKVVLYSPEAWQVLRVNDEKIEIPH